MLQFNTHWANIWLEIEVKVKKTHDIRPLGKKIHTLKLWDSVEIDIEIDD